MVKDIIIALLTTTINRFESANTNMVPKNVVLGELNVILDYVSDLQEEDKEPITGVLNNTKEVEVLKKRIRELEEICQDNNEVIENQFKKIQRFEAANEELANRPGIKPCGGK